MKINFKDIIIIILALIIISMYNTTISWSYKGKIWNYKLGHFYLEKIGLRSE